MGAIEADPRRCLPIAPASVCVVADPLQCFRAVRSCSFSNTTPHGVMCYLPIARAFRNAASARTAAMAGAYLPLGKAHFNPATKFSFGAG